MSGRTLAIGDIHGCDSALNVLLSELRLDIDDTVVLIGDIVDRGPGTRQVIDRLLEVAETCRLIFIRGNHEEMMLDALKRGPLEPTWLRYGGQEALDSYSDRETPTDRYEQIPTSHVEFLNSSKDFWETETEIFVHGNMEPHIALEDQTREWLRWTRLTGFEKPHPSGKRVLCGHTPQADGLPAVLEGWVCLDTWAYNGLYLTCLDLTNETFYQSQQSGGFRALPLDDLE
jgi:serine/threonine protein phosphatase 1